MLAGLFRFVAGFGATSHFQQARIRCTYYGDQSAPSEPDIMSILDKFAQKSEEQQPRAQEAFRIFLKSLQRGDQRKQWVFVLKSLIVMDRCVEDRVMLHELATYQNNYLQNYQGSGANNSQLINRLVQHYFCYIRDKANTYSNSKAVLSQPKSERSAYIDRLTLQKIEEEIGTCIPLEQTILKTNDIYKNGSRRPEVIQYVFDLLLCTLLTCHSVHFRCITTLIKRAPTMNREWLSKLRTHIERMDKNTSRNIVNFIEANKEIEGYKDVKYKEFYRFGQKPLQLIDELRKNIETRESSRYSQILVVSVNEKLDEQLSSEMPKKQFMKRNKYFKAADKRKDIHYTKLQGQDPFSAWQNGYAASFEATTYASKHSSDIRRSNSNPTSKIFQDFILTTIGIKKDLHIKFDRQRWNQYQNVYATNE